MITFLLLDFLGGSQRILWKNENAVYRRLQISALVPEILKFEKGIKYANELTDDVIYSNVKQANISTCLLEDVHEAPFANMTEMGHQRWPEILLILGSSGTQYVAMLTKLLSSNYGILLQTFLIQTGLDILFRHI